jgi:hypothetical protein
MLPLIQNGLELGRCYCRYPVQIEVSSSAVNVLTFLPEFTLLQNGLTLSRAFTGPTDIQVTWDFGGNSAIA